ncbi:MAG: hypothetical protein NTY81_01880 [Candidatus Staskawiczbacteria bacterium]|nr:hypothetical protein [Candidatus Staskawiczbacteria bacterium]
MKKINIIILIIICLVVILIGGYFADKYLLSHKSEPITCTMEAKICPDGSTVGRTGPNCEFAQCPDWRNYKNNEYGFEMTFPDSWKGFTIDGSKLWHGNSLDNSNVKYDGPMIVFVNPKTTSKIQYQDIPIMVFTPDVWKMVNGENPIIAVSAAPIGPAKIGENSKYVFATPPRWYGFTDAVGFQEAVEIVKTFKAF